jgi:hypothetical protein
MVRRVMCKHYPECLREVAKVVCATREQFDCEGCHSFVYEGEKDEIAFYDELTGISELLETIFQKRTISRRAWKGGGASFLNSLNKGRPIL